MHLSHDQSGPFELRGALVVTELEAIVMGLCKCPKRKVTNLFCFVHRVNVCEDCMVGQHPRVSIREEGERGNLWREGLVIMLCTFVYGSVWYSRT